MSCCNAIEVRPATRPPGDTHFTCLVMIVQNLSGRVSPIPYTLSDTSKV